MPDYREMLKQTHLFPPQEGVQPPGVTPNDVIDLVSQIPQVSPKGELEWIVKDGLAVEMYRQHYGVRRSPRLHADLDIWVFRNYGIYRALGNQEVTRKRLDVQSPLVSRYFIQFPEALILDTVREIPITSQTSIHVFCIHPALIALHKITDPRSLRDQDRCDLDVLSDLRQSSLVNMQVWDRIIYRAIRCLDSSLQNRATERWQIFKGNPDNL